MQPGLELIKQQVQWKYPGWVRLLLRGWLRARMERYERKHFSGQRNGAAFQRFKSYRVLLLELTS